MTVTTGNPGNPYAVLGLPREASPADIRKAYYDLVRRHPPERDPEGFRRVRAAYEALRTHSARANTDRQLVQMPAPFAPPRRTPAYDLSFHPEDRFREARRETDLENLDFSLDFRPIPDLLDDIADDNDEVDS